MKEPKVAPRCEACRRPRWRGPAMHEAEIQTIGATFLCVNVTDCKRYWI